MVSAGTKVLRILSLASCSFLNEVIAKRLRAMGVIMDVALFEDYKESLEKVKQYDLVIMEAQEEAITDVYSILKKINETISITSMILIADGMDFHKKSELFRDGVLTVFEKEGFEVEALVEYIATVKFERENIEILKNKRIAVLDDSRLSLEIIKDYFQHLNVTNTSFFQSSQDLLHSSMAYDMYIIDLVMPEFTGDQVIRNIRKNNKDAIILLVTTYSDVGMIQHCLSLGANDFIIKPFNYRMFMLRINASIVQHRMNEENSKSHELLYCMATKDSLTHVYNRAYFMDVLKLQLKAHENARSQFSVILMDIDDFKHVNDTCGHLKGDEVLVAVAKVMEASLRDTDVVCRWGGEEFCAILPNTSMEKALSLAEKLREAIYELHIAGVKRITGSFGVTTVEDGDTEMRIFKRLDNSLYLAKLTGKNKIVVNEEMVITSEHAPISVSWGPFFKSGNEQIDHEHYKMIQISNKIIEACFNDEAYEETMELFNELVEETVNHFKNEEEILEKIGYQDVEEHKKIHKDLLEKMFKMQSGLESKQFTPLHVAQYMIQDVVVGHIIKSDFEYYDCFIG